MQLSYSSQFRTSCIIIELGDHDPDKIIECAEEEGAVYFDGKEDLIVVDFQNNPKRMVGPECYTKSALKRSIK